MRCPPSMDSPPFHLLALPARRREAETQLTGAALRPTRSHPGTSPSTVGALPQGLVSLTVRAIPTNRRRVPWSAAEDRLREGQL